MLSAEDVAADVRVDLPDAEGTKLHALLYYCQGHHLAWFKEALFADPIAMTDLGPRVLSLRGDGDTAALDTRESNTVGYVISRYGSLTARDLSVLTRGEDPCRVPIGEPVELSVMARYFTRDHDENRPESPAIREWLARTAPQGPMESTGTDDTPRLRAKVEALRAKINARGAAAVEA